MLHSVLRVVAWSLGALAMAAVAVAVVVPRVAGATPYTVLTGSMTPGLPPGTLLVVKPAGPGEIGTGDVITYQLRSGEETVVTHRVVAIAVSDTGETLYRAQGDANASPDQGWVRAVQVRGKLWYAVPHLGRASAFLSAQQRDLGSRGVGALLAGYAAVVALRAAAARARRSRVTETRPTRARHRVAAQG